MKGIEFMINKAYEGNKSLTGLKRVTPTLQAKIRRVLNGEWNTLEDENILIFAGTEGGSGAYARFFYQKHDIAVDANDGTITVFEYDYHGGGFWASEAREIGKFQF